MPTLENFNGRSLVADVGGSINRGLTMRNNWDTINRNQADWESNNAKQKQIELLRGKMIPGTTGYDPNAANDLRKIDPKAADELLTSMGIDDEMKREEAARFAYRLEQTPFHLRAPLIEERVGEIDARYGNETHSSDTRELLAADEQTQNRMIKGFQQAALTAKQRADINKTNQGLASAKTEILDGGAVIQALPDGSVTVRDPAGNIVKGQARLDVLAQSRTQEINHKAAVEGAKEASKLGAQYKLEPQVKEAVAIALENVKIQSEVASEDRSNEKALGVYEVATKGLTDALSGATTGPGMEYLPALTANQQVAKGAVAAMAPVLKQLFRGAGEGTFTDKDQALLLDMIPTRNDHAETRAAKLANIDAIVRAKLGQEVSSPNDGAGSSPAEGQTATNPQTGQKIIFRGGEWVSM